MKINFEQVLVDLDGDPIKDDTKKDSRDATLGSVARNALLARFPDEQNLSGDEQFHRYELASFTKGGHDWPAEDVALLKKLISKAYGPLIIGRSYELIEPKLKSATG